MATTVSTSFTPAIPTALCAASLPMASTSPAAPELSVEPVHSAELASCGCESACDSAVSPRAESPRMHALPANTVASVRMESDEEDALAAGESY